MKAFATLLALILILCLSGCAFDQVGIGASYTDPNSGAIYAGNVNLHIKDDAKEVRSPKVIKPPVLAKLDDRPPFNLYHNGQAIIVR